MLQNNSNRTVNVFFHSGEIVSVLPNKCLDPQIHKALGKIRAVKFKKVL